MSIIREPNYFAELLSVKQSDGTPYEPDDWRNKYIGKSGHIVFRYYSHCIRFLKYSDNEEDYIEWDFFTGPVVNIKEEDSFIVFTTVNSIYEFKVIHKTPNEDTQDYFDAFVATEEYFEELKRFFENARKKAGCEEAKALKDNMKDETNEQE